MAESSRNDRSHQPVVPRTLLRINTTEPLQPSDGSSSAAAAITPTTPQPATMQELCAFCNQVSMHVFTPGLQHDSFPPNRPMSTVDIILGPLPQACCNEPVVRQILRAVCNDCIVFGVQVCKRRSEWMTAVINADAKKRVLQHSRALVCLAEACCWATGARGEEAIVSWSYAMLHPVVAIEPAATREVKQNRNRDMLTRDLMAEPSSSRVLVCPTCAPQHRVSFALACLGQETGSLGLACFACNQQFAERDMALWCAACNSFLCIVCLHDASKFAYNKGVLAILKRRDKTHASKEAAAQLSSRSEGSESV